MVEQISRLIEIYARLVWHPVIVQRHDDRLREYLALSDRHVVSTFFTDLELLALSIP